MKKGNALDITDFDPRHVDQTPTKHSALFLLYLWAGNEWVSNGFITGGIVLYTNMNESGRLPLRVLINGGRKAKCLCK